MNKYMELKLKKVFKGGGDISSIDTEAYYKRFLNFIKRIVIVYNDWFISFHHFYSWNATPDVLRFLPIHPFKSSMMGSRSPPPPPPSSLSLSLLFFYSLSFFWCFSSDNFRFYLGELCYLSLLEGLCRIVEPWNRLEEVRLTSWVLMRLVAFEKLNIYII